LFSAFDLNNDGTLALGELRHFLGQGARDLCKEMDAFKLPAHLAPQNACISPEAWSAFFNQVEPDVLEIKLSQLERVVKDTDIPKRRQEYRSAK
jgi:hypothetical protein